MKGGIRTVRRAQTVTPFGVGAIYDIGDESFVAMDTWHWKGAGEVRRLPRLAEVLGVNDFHLAPDGAAGHGVPYFRFPQWMFCQSCRQMLRWSYKREAGTDSARCLSCKGSKRLVPMRFVNACKRGHLSDVPWDRWAHSAAGDHAQRQCGNSNELRFKVSREVGGGLRSLSVHCGSCGASRDLEFLVRKDSLKTIGYRCPGRQPWQLSDLKEECQEVPQVLQRGASNIYFARVASALDIPEGDAAGEREALVENIENHAYFRLLRQLSESSSDGLDAPGARIAIEQIASDFGCGVEIVREVVQRAGGVPAEAQARTAEDLLVEEYASLCGEPQPETGAGLSFVTESVDLAEWIARSGQGGTAMADIGKLVGRVVLVHRLREVRALVGFERVDPGVRTTSPGLDKRIAWLPAMEVYGEGVFLSLDADALVRWEQEHASWLAPRVAAIALRRNQARLSFLPEPSARLLLLHTLAHLLIRQLAFECGYSSSSLRERIYASPSMAGFLIYTADADSEGSLGGLAREGRADRLARTLSSALSKAAWCSADPVCRELPAQGLGGLNRAACHACALVPETSCQFGNVLLDRQFVVGAQGFFGDLVVGQGSVPGDAP